MLNNKVKILIRMINFVEKSSRLRWEVLLNNIFFELIFDVYKFYSIYS